MAKIYTIPASLSFADHLAKGLLERVSFDPKGLIDYRIILPTRRACRTVREAFLRCGAGQMILLPKLETIGDPDEDELDILSASSASAFDVDIPPAINPLTRLALLAKEIKKAAQFSGDDAGALKLANDLMRFLDELYIENKELNDLKDLVLEENLAKHWQITLDFLSILKDRWPAILEERGEIDQSDRRNRLLKTQAKLWFETPPQTPIIAAGITGSVPATNDVLKAILNAPKGEVILPGFDLEMDAGSWDDMEPSHPQAGFKNLLHNLSIARTGVSIWPDLKEKGQPHKEKLMSEVMRPATQTQKWKTEKRLHKNSADHISLIECSNHHEESSVIALMMREVLEDPERKKTATLITPDRNLAARVQEKLKRWDIEIDDSAGQSLPRTQAGRFMLSLLEMMARHFSPITLLGVLKQGLCGNAIHEDMRNIVKTLDKLLRGEAPPQGIDGLRIALENQKDNPEANESLIAQINSLLENIDPILSLLKPAEEMIEQGNHSLSEWIEMHIYIAESLAATQEIEGVARLWAGEEGEAVAKLFSNLLEQAHHFETLSFNGYHALLETLMKSITVRPRYGMHPRLSILGLMEARLAHSNLVVLAGLNENTWPADVKADPWLSRPMRKQFGLPSPEAKIGFSAHDFVQQSCAQNVVLTRARTVDSTPQISSRWLMRMNAVLSAHDLCLPNHDYYKAWATKLDEAEGQAMPAQRPAPCPPIEARPRNISVTNIETWMRDPYAIYAKKVLGLRKFDDLEKEQDAAQRGQIIHDSLHHFVRDHAMNEWPENAQEMIIKIGTQEAQKRGIAKPELMPWWPRFVKLAAWIDGHEKQWRASGAKPVRLEVKGSCSLQTDYKPFELEARADRIDRLKDGRLVIIDYKTGKIYSEAEIKQGFKPQMPLEGVIANDGAFDDLKQSNVADLQFWQIIGDEKMTGSVLSMNEKYATEELIADARTGVVALINAFDDKDMPFYSLPNDAKAPRFQDYAHLARVKEWANESEAS